MLIEPAPARPGLGRPFATLWTATGISTFGDGVFATGLPLLAAQITRDPLQVSVITSAAFLPWLLVGLPSGALVDRRDRRQVMWTVDLGRCAVVGAVAMAVAMGWASIALLAAGAFLLGVGQTLFDSAAQSLAPALVSVDEQALSRANGRLVGAQTVSEQFLGPPAGGFLYTVAATIPFVVDAVSFLFSAALVALIPGVYKVADGLRWLWSHRLLRVLAVMVGVMNLAGAAGDAILVLYARERLGLTGTGYGLLLASLAVGGLAGSLVAARLARRFGTSAIITAAAAINGLGWAAIGLTSHPLAVGALLAAVSGATTVWNVTTVSLRQSIVPDHLMGRVVSTYRFVAYGTIPLGAILGGLIARGVGLPAPFLVGGVAILALALVSRPAVSQRRIDQAKAQPDGPSAATR